MHSQLGSIIFEGLKGFTSLSDNRETNLIEHPLIENKPRLQRVGQNLQNIEGSILFDVSFCNPQAELDALESARVAGQIMPLIMGDGRFIGEFVIKSLKVALSNDASDGSALQREVSISLIEYADADRETTAQVNAIAQGFANAANRPQMFTPTPFEGTPEAAAIAGVVDANAAATSAAETLQEFDYVEEQYRPKAEYVVQKMVRVGDDLNEVLQIINADPASELYERTRDLALRIPVMVLLSNDVIIECQDLISDIDNGNTLGIPARIVTLVGKGTEVQTRSGQLISSASNLTALVITQ